MIAMISCVGESVYNESLGLECLSCRKGQGKDGIGRAAAEEGLHVTRARVTLGIFSRVCELQESRKKGRVVIWDGSDRIKGWRVGTFCGGRVETGRARKALTRVRQ